MAPSSTISGSFIPLDFGEKGIYAYYTLPKLAGNSEFISVFPGTENLFTRQYRLARIKVRSRQPALGTPQSTGVPAGCREVSIGVSLAYSR